MFLGEVLNGLMHGYGEFYWGDSGKRYFGFYEEDKDMALGVIYGNLNHSMRSWASGKEER
jgi:hypothetical protein